MSDFSFDRLVLGGFNFGFHRIIRHNPALEKHTHPLQHSPVLPATVHQGLTLVHFSAPRKRFLCAARVHYLAWRDHHLLRAMLRGCIGKNVSS